MSSRDWINRVNWSWKHNSNGPMIERTIPFAFRPVDIAQAQRGAPAASQTTHAGSSQNVGQRQNGQQGERALSDDQLYSLLGKLQASLTALSSQRNTDLDELRRVAVELSVAVASRLVHEKINSGDFAVEEIVGRVVDQLKSTASLTVHLHPNDLVLLKDRTQSTTPAWQELRDIQFVPDGTMRRGDCRIAAGETGLLSEISSQLSEIRCHLLEGLSDVRDERRLA